MKAAITWFTLRNRGARRLWALVWLTAFIALPLLSSSELLHHHLHADADAPDHACAVTLLTHGQVDATDTGAVQACFASAFVFSLPAVQTPVQAAPDCRLSPSRAPPALPWLRRVAG